MEAIIIKTPQDVNFLLVPFETSDGLVEIDINYLRQLYMDIGLVPTIKAMRMVRVENRYLSLTVAKRIIDHCVGVNWEFGK